jgi:hypothetical protein
MAIIGLTAPPAHAQEEDRTTIEGRVDFLGYSVPNTKVDLFTAGRGRFVDDTRTDANGRFRFDVAPGQYTLTFVAPAHTYFARQTRYLNRSVYVGPGQRSVNNNASIRTIDVNVVNQPTQQPNCFSAQPIYSQGFDTAVDANGFSSAYPEWLRYNGPGHREAGVVNGRRDPSAFSVSNGHLTITGRRSYDSNGQPSVISGGAKLRNRTQTYGAYEARVKMAGTRDPGLSGVFMTWPTSGLHPLHGELNMYETLGQVSSFSSFIHQPSSVGTTASSGGTVTKQLFHRHGVNSGWQTGQEQADTASINVFDNWYTIRMEWTPDSIRIFRDGTQVFETTSSDRPPAGDVLPGEDGNYIPDVDHDLTIQLDAKSPVAQGQTFFLVDYVKVWDYTC